MAAAAGVTQQTLLNHFSSEEGLLLALADVLGPEIEALRGPVPPGDVATFVRGLVRRYESLGDADTRLAAIAERVPGLTEAVELARTRHTAWLEEAFGEQLPTDPGASALSATMERRARQAHQGAGRRRSRALPADGPGPGRQRGPDRPATAPCWGCPPRPPLPGSRPVPAGCWRALPAAAPPRRSARRRRADAASRTLVDGVGALAGGHARGTDRGLTHPDVPAVADRPRPWQGRSHRRGSPAAPGRTA